MPSPTSSTSPRLDSVASIGKHLDVLVARDDRLAAIRARAGEVSPRLTQAGFAGLAQVVCGQQLSVASARAIWGRFAMLEGALDPGGYLLLDEASVRGTGFSAGKFRTLRAVAQAIDAGKLDLERIGTLDVGTAIAELVAVPGIGPWTAEIYLLFCAGHPDIFPSGDLALQKAVGQGLGFGDRIDAKTLSAVAVDWAPHRGAAALLFWRYYAALRDKEGIAL